VKKKKNLTKEEEEPQQPNPFLRNANPKSKNTHSSKHKSKHNPTVVLISEHVLLG